MKTILIKDKVQSFLWSLPYNVRLALIRIFKSSRYRRLRAKRFNQDLKSSSFEPFVKHEAIFVHLPKCAGISVAHTLFGHFGGSHTRMSDYMIAFDKGEFESYFKFTIVRNPWDRLFSAYHFLKQGGLHEMDQECAERHIELYQSFEAFVLDWVNIENVERVLHFVPQYRFLCKPGSKEPLVNFVGYYENLTEDFHYIAQHLGKNLSLREDNRTKGKKKSYKDAYTQEMIKIVEEVYLEDIQIFGYDFDNQNLKQVLANRNLSFN